MTSNHVHSRLHAYGNFSDDVSWDFHSVDHLLARNFFCFHLRRKFFLSFSEIQIVQESKALTRFNRAETFPWHLFVDFYCLTFTAAVKTICMWHRETEVKHISNISRLKGFHYGGLKANLNVLKAWYCWLLPSFEAYCCAWFRTLKV